MLGCSNWQMELDQTAWAMVSKTYINSEIDTDQFKPSWGVVEFRDSSYCHYSSAFVGFERACGTWYRVGDSLAFEWNDMGGYHLTKGKLTFNSRKMATLKGEGLIIELRRVEFGDYRNQDLPVIENLVKH